MTNRLQQQNDRDEMQNDGGKEEVEVGGEESEVAEVVAEMTGMTGMTGMAGVAQVTQVAGAQGEAPEKGGEGENGKQRAGSENSKRTTNTPKEPDSASASASASKGSSNGSSESSSRNSSKPGGYSADCSSLSHCSDSSSETSNSNGNRNDSPSKIQHQHPHQHQHQHQVGGQKSSLVGNNGTTAPSSFHSASSPFVPVSRNTHSRNHNGSTQKKRSSKKQNKTQKDPKKIVLPQWQGVRVINPMDPRIDLSSVGMIPASSLYNDYGDGDEEGTTSKDRAKLKRPSESCSNYSNGDHDHDQSQMEESPNQSTKNTLINQYNDLFNTLEVSSSIQALSRVNLSQDATMETQDAPIVNMEPPQGHQAANESDSSMVVLARVKRKYQKDSIPCQDVIENVPQVLQGPGPAQMEMQMQIPQEQIPQVQLSQAELRNLAPSIVTDSINGGTGTGSTGSDQARTESNSESIKTKDRTPSSTNKSDKKEEVNDEAATLERLALKKRKRLDKRREYEEEVQRKHDESSDVFHRQSGKIFRAGEAITMEEALSFASCARLIVQGTPPYLAVHVNAGFSRLTGMHNSGIIGRPLCRILSVIESTCTKGKTPENTSTTSGEDLIDDKEQQNSRSIDRLMTNSDLERYHKANTIEIVDKSDDNKGNSTSANEGSNNSSITSKEDSFTPIQCLMSICAIVSTSPQRTRHSSKPKKQEKVNFQEPQLPKNLLSPSNTQHDPKRQRITLRQNAVISDHEVLKKSHYLIQLSTCDDSGLSLEEKATGNTQSGVQGDQEDNNTADSSQSSIHAVG